MLKKEFNIYNVYCSYAGALIKLGRDLLLESFDDDEISEDEFLLLYD